MLIGHILINGQISASPLGYKLPRVKYSSLVCNVNLMSFKINNSFIAKQNRVK